MLRYEDLKDISDGKVYGPDDQALLGTDGCRGCSYCCKSDMGDSIVLTPYDVYELTLGTGLSFDDMLVGGQIEISMIDGLAMPHLKMDQGCKFLMDDRCSIHNYRPGICRLFPLGRLYKDKGFDYILQTQQCICENRTPVTIRDWLGIDDLAQNDAFIIKWRGFLKYERKKVSEINEMSGYEMERIRGLEEKELREYASIVGDKEEQDFDLEQYRQDKLEELSQEAEDRIREVMKSVLSVMYMDSYDKNVAFYSQFDSRLKQSFAIIRKL
ncbi:MAG: YkgJ family cysteine cluster protein [Eubacterium sp.]|nr:YkgJ family cysteine cluster protein [Eubacterium sp.]